MQFCFVVTSDFSFTSSLFHCSSGKRAHVLLSCHMTMQLHRGTGRALFKKSQCIWGRTQQINWDPVFLKADLCQQGDPHTVWSSIALISTELLCLVGVKNLVPSACDSFRMLMQLLLLCLGKVLPLPLPLPLPVFFLWPSNPAMHCSSPYFFEGYPYSMWRAMFVAGCC